MRRVVDVDLGLICARRHDPVAIFAHAHTLAGLFKLEILQQVDAVCKLGIIFQAAFPLADEPLGQRAGLAATDGVDRHVSLRDFHGGGGGGGSVRRETRNEVCKPGRRSLEVWKFAIVQQKRAGPGL